MGECPKCGSSLCYADIELQDNMVCFPYECEDCKTQVKEWYSLEFESMEVLENE